MFPAQVKISTRCVGWQDSPVADWMRNPTFYEVHTARLQGWLTASAQVVQRIGTAFGERTFIIDELTADP